MKTLAIVYLGLFSGIVAVCAGEVSFTAKPSVAKVGDKYEITFSVSGLTDVAVYIESANGEVIRHLVAGVLGNDPPPPLKPGLSQTVEWDGKADFGKPAGEGPFSVRVGLGLGAKYDRVVYSFLPDLRYDATLATAPNGKLYISFGRNRWHPAGCRWRVFDRDGKFESTWGVPPGPEAARYFGWTSDVYRPDPMNFRELNFSAGDSTIYTMASTGRGDAVVIGPDGKDLFQLGTVNPPCINRYPLTADCPKEDTFSVKLEGIGATGAHRSAGCLAVSSDAKALYVGGLTSGNNDAKKDLAAVYAVNYPDRSGCRVLFGDPSKHGSDSKSLGGAPSGLAVDGKGRLFVADTSNNRVVVIDEKSGAFLGEIGIKKPVRLGFSTRARALYVLSVVGKAGTLQRYKLPADTDPKNWGNLQPEAKMPMSFMYDKNGFALAVDDSETPAVIWVGGGWNQTRRIEDTGTGPEFGTMTDFSTKGLRTEQGMMDNLPCADVEVDRLRKEVYFRVGGNGNYYGRFIEKTEKTEFIGLPASTLWGGAGVQACPAPNGNLYGLVWSKNFYQWDRQGKPVRWEVPAHADSDWVWDCFKWHEKNFPKEKIPQTAYVPVAMSGLPHMLGVRWSDGHVFVLHPRVSSERVCKALHEYQPNGKWMTGWENPILWKVSDLATGPKFDAAGNIYIAEAVRPKGWIVPPEWKAYFAKKGLDTSGAGQIPKQVDIAARLYGSIVKFSPKGGMIDFVNPPQWATCFKGTPYTGKPKLDEGLKEIDAEYYYDGNRPAKLTGAEWIHPGFGHIGPCRCNCESATFDVDEFGRTFFPDTVQFQVRVIDTSGNAICKFGDFGSENCMGPESPVVDPKSHRLRPPRADDPTDLVSPFAKPEIAFSWVVGVGVTDRYAYFGDTLNLRLLRAKLVYAEEGTAPIP